MPGLSRIVHMSAAALILTSISPLQSSSGMEPTLKTKQTMILHLHRTRHSKHGTFGILDVNGKGTVYTLEETELQVPPGTYPVELTFSPRFHRLLPLLIVPHRSAIRIHAGNWPRDSHGCILVGQSRGDNMIGHSLLALDLLVKQIQSALASGLTVFIEIS